MRLWSLHPKYLDRKALVAVWREALLARKVIKDKLKAYANHPQLIRFKKQDKPIAFINAYLKGLFDESCERGYCFNKSLIKGPLTNKKINVTEGQLEYELDHLKSKLRKRDKIKFNELLKVSKPIPHPLFRKVKGLVEDWEKT